MELTFLRSECSATNVSHISIFEAFSVLKNWTSVSDSAKARNLKIWCSIRQLHLQRVYEICSQFHMQNRKENWRCVLKVLLFSPKVKVLKVKWGYCWSQIISYSSFRKIHFDIWSCREPNKSAIQSSKFGSFVFGTDLVTEQAILIKTLVSNGCSYMFSIAEIK